MDIQSLGPEVVEFLDAPRYAVIATHDADGSLWQAVAWYAVRGDVILMNSLDGRRWPTNIRRNPFLSFAVVDGEDYVILRGNAFVTDDPDQAQVEARELAVLYGSDPDTFAGQRRVGIRFHPEHIGVHGRFRLGTAETD